MGHKMSIDQQMIDGINSLKNRFSALKSDIETNNEFGASMDDIADVSKRINTIDAMANEGDIQNAMSLYKSIDDQLNSLMGTDETTQDPVVEPDTVAPTVKKKVAKAAAHIKLSDMRDAIKQFGNQKEISYVSKYDDALREIKDYQSSKKEKMNIGDAKSMTDAKEIDEEIRIIQNKFGPSSRFAKMINVMFRGVKDQYMNSLKSGGKDQKDTDNLDSLKTEKIEQFKTQYGSILSNLKLLIKNRPDIEPEALDHIKQTLSDAMEEFKTIKDKAFTNDGELRSAFNGPTNAINPLVKTIRNLAKGKKYETPEEQEASASDRDTKYWEDLAKRQDKIERIKQAKIAKSKKKKLTGIERLAQKIAAPDQDAVKTEPSVEPEVDPVKPEPVVTGIDSQLDLIDQEFAAGNENELDHDLAKYAKGLAAKIETPEDEADAQKAIDAVLDGYTMEEFMNAGTLTESRKRFNKRILDLFDE